MRYFLSIAYDGTNYHGWQIQPNAITVQVLVNDAISKIVREPVNVVGCGRTDTGVHASWYVLHFDINSKIADYGKFLYHLNAVLPPDIVAFKIAESNDSTHARFDAQWRQYHYFFTTEHLPFLNKYTTRLVKMPHIELLQKAAEFVRQQNDFASFCKAHSANKTTICSILECDWVYQNEFLVFRIKADRFLRNMVRALAGTMLDVGFEKITLDKFQHIFEARNRSSAGLSVTPSGLFLTGIGYDKLPEISGAKLPFLY